MCFHSSRPGTTGFLLTTELSPIPHLPSVKIHPRYPAALRVGAAITMAPAASRPCPRGSRDILWRVLGWRIVTSIVWSVLLLPICTTVFVIFSSIDLFHPIQWLPKKKIHPRGNNPRPLPQDIQVLSLTSSSQKPKCTSGVSFNAKVE